MDQDKLQTIINESDKIVIVQADNPDADSLGSALALEQILGDMGKTVYLYCSVNIPEYLHYLAGWDRVSDDLPTDFQASIMVDVSTLTLIEKLRSSSQLNQLAHKPCLVLDHHKTASNPIPFASLVINDYQVSSTGELIYNLAKTLRWTLNQTAQMFIMAAILGDTQGLANQLATSATYRVIADILDHGVSRLKLEELRRDYTKMPLEIFRYKADLIKRTELDESGRVALVTVPDQEIKTYSPLYNPVPLIQGDMLQIAGVKAAIVLKHYQSGRITGAIRTDFGVNIAASLADSFNGGGHDYASGFKLEGRDIKTLKKDLLDKANQLLDDWEKGNVRYENL